MSQTYEKERQQEQIQVQQEQLQQEQPQQEYAVQQAVPEQEVLRQEENQQELALNAQLTEQARQQLPAAQAVRAAPGAPVQDEALPAPTGYKARRREKKHAKLAKKACPVGTALTYDLVTGSKQVLDRKHLSADECPEMQTCSTFNRRVLMAFCRGYQKGRLGVMSARDKANKAADHKLFTEYLSGDLERRKPILDGFVRELLAFRFTPDMLTVRNVRRNISKYRDIMDKAFAMNDIMKDPSNAPYFNALDPMTLQALNSVLDMAVPFCGAMFNLCSKYGCDINAGTYIDHNHRQDIRTARASFPGSLANYQQAQEEHQHQVRQCGEDYAVRVRQNEELLRQALADSGVTLALAERQAPWLVKGAALLQAGEEHRAENVAVVRMLVQYHQSPGGAPSKELYEQVKNRLVPRVQRIMDCDVNALAALPDSALILHAAELNQMLLDVQMLDQLMNNKHHAASPRQTSSYVTLGNDLLRYKGPEYTYQSSMIQALAQRARALAVGYMTEQGGADAACFTREDQFPAGGIPAWTEQQLAAASQQMEDSRTRLQNSTIVGTQEFSARLEQGAHISKNMADLMDDPLAQVAWEYEHGQTPAIQAVRQRLQDKPYYSLNYTPEELKARNLPENLSESLFRRFGAFLQSRAAQAMLSPDAFRQMIEDLGAGAGLQRTAPLGQDPNEVALAEAAQRNAAGLQQLKHVLGAHFRYLEDKYGPDIVSLTPEEIAMHQEDLSADFAFSQVALKLLDSFPDFFSQQPENLEELYFINRLQYYATVGKSLNDMYLILRTATNREDAIAGMEAFWQTAMDANYEQLYTNMRARHPGFSHHVRWDKDVQ